MSLVFCGGADCVGLGVEVLELGRTIRPSAVLVVNRGGAEAQKN